MSTDGNSKFVKYGELETWPTRFRDYALSRGLTSEQIIKWGIGYIDEGPLEDRIYVPILDKSNTLVHFAARSILTCNNGESKAKARWADTVDLLPTRHAVWFGENHWEKVSCNFTKKKGAARPPFVLVRHECVVVEGVFDALKIDRLFPWLPVAGFHYLYQPQTAYDRLAYEFDRLLVLTDSDVVGDKLATTIEDSVRASGSRCEVVRKRLPISKDPSEASEEELREVLGL